MNHKIPLTSIMLRKNASSIVLKTATIYVSILNCNRFRKMLQSHVWFVVYMVRIFKDAIHGIFVEVVK